MTRLLLDALDWRVTCPTPALAAGLALQQLGGRLGAATHALTAYLLVRGAAGGAVRVGGRGGGVLSCAQYSAEAVAQARG